MSYGVRVRVRGDYACFTRPEMKAERVSYEVMTPSAARGVLEAIYWKPEIRWMVEKIHVMKPIRFTSVRRNELSDKASLDKILTAMKRGTGNLALFIEDKRQQRAAIILRDVDYIIEAHFEILSGEKNDGKHLDQFNRRVKDGACFHRPYLGCREFPALFESVDEIPASPVKGDRALGYMLHDIDHANDRTAHFFHAKLVDGVLTVPPLKPAQVKP